MQTITSTLPWKSLTDLRGLQCCYPLLHPSSQRLAVFRALPPPRSPLHFPRQHHCLATYYTFVPLCLADRLKGYRNHTRTPPPNPDSVYCARHRAPPRARRLASGLQSLDHATTHKADLREEALLLSIHCKSAARLDNHHAANFPAATTVLTMVIESPTGSGHVETAHGTRRQLHASAREGSVFSIQ